ncbi:hypothetical protein HEB29_001716 [Streptomyces fulvorobeus]|uniref:Uncharacterized protein n=1 Tax=Streptomyces fulvorobeus TaxID=284028 RepID=A0A7Y9KVR4_9ACTN|nr:hypothetical protein [Streptomyces fulvorobeus]
MALQTSISTGDLAKKNEQSQQKRAAEKAAKPK